MTIDATAKGMPTGEGNPTAGTTINDLDFSTVDLHRHGNQWVKAAVVPLGAMLRLDCDRW